MWGGGGGGVSSTHTNGQHPPDNATAAIVLQNTHQLQVERRESDAANQCMGVIRRPVG